MLLLVWAHEGLMPRGAEVHDREAPMGEADRTARAAILKEPCVIRATGGERITGALKLRAREERLRADISDEATHTRCWTSA